MFMNMNMNMKYDYLTVEGIRIFYRETETVNKPYLVLFHGFPSSSHQFRGLIAELKDDFHIIAPDYPGFGQSDIPSRKEFSYTFDNIAVVIDKFLEAKSIDKFYMFVFDYGAPIGFRIAVKHPDKILGIVSQNGNVYEEGLGKKWKARAEYWENPTDELREQYKSAFAPETIIGQYTFGTATNTVSPDGYSLDIYYSKVINDYAEIQSDLIYDYQNNVKLYPVFHKYLRKYQPKLLAIWGKNDPSFIPAGAEAFKKDLPNAIVKFVDSGHFALETHYQEIAESIKEFFSETTSFRPMRRFKQALSDEECARILKTEKRGTLAVNGDNGYPYALPINFYYDESDRKIFFHSAREGHKIDAIGKNDKVCFIVYDSGEKRGDWSYYVKSVIIFGYAKPVTDLLIKREKAKMFGMKYYPSEEELDRELERDFDRVQIMEISINHISGKLVHEK